MIEHLQPLIKECHFILQILLQKNLLLHFSLIGFNKSETKACLICIKYFDAINHATCQFYESQVEVYSIPATNFFQEGIKQHLK